MSEINDILRMIDRLSEDERAELEARLAERLETQWRQEAERARHDAKRRGLDQDWIARAVDQQRYGR